jgi:glycosyltransferase involved in cell wall biosynthesis
MASTPLVSVVMPAFNAAGTIADAIGSVLNGTFRDFEIIVCDDASTDSTAEVVTEFGDPRVRLVRNPSNLGEGPSRDHAIDLASGRWLAVLDADDQFTPDRLAALVDVAQAHPSAIIFDDLMDCHDAPVGLRPWRALRGPGAWGSGSNAPVKVAFADWIVQRRTLMKPVMPLAWIRENDIRHSRKRFGADLEFFLKVVALARAELWYVPRPMYLYRIAANSMTATPDRYTMLAETLENAMPLFSHDTVAQSALRRKAESIRKSEAYQAFFSELMHGHIAASARTMCRQPWVIPELLRRSIERVPYHLSRWWNGGARRKTT